MASVTGIGGAFLRVSDPKALYEWYEQNLGLKRVHGSFIFEKETQTGAVSVAFFAETGAHFPDRQKAMLNFQVDDLDALLDSLASKGVTVDPKRDTYDFGKFGAFTDPEGNRVELWQPTDHD